MRQEETQDTTVHFPKSVLPSVRASEIPLAGVRILRLIVREQAIDEEGVDYNQGQGESAGDAEGVGDGDALVHGVGVLDGDVLEGEVLVVGFDGIDDPESDHTGTDTVSWGGMSLRWGSVIHENHIVEDVAVAELVGEDAGKGSQHTK